MAADNQGMPRSAAHTQYAANGRERVASLRMSGFLLSSNFSPLGWGRMRAADGTGLRVSRCFLGTPYPMTLSATIEQGNLEFFNETLCRAAAGGL